MESRKSRLICDGVRSQGRYGVGRRSLLIGGRSTYAGKALNESVPAPSSERKRGNGSALTAEAVIGAVERYPKDVSDGDRAYRRLASSGGQSEPLEEPDAVSCPSGRRAPFGAEDLIQSIIVVPFLYIPSFPGYCRTFPAPNGLGPLRGASLEFVQELHRR